MKILIIDDTPEALAVARARLAKEHVEIVCAKGGIAGLETAVRERPDLVLLDIDMPDMSGFEVCRRLKSNPDLFMIPVLFLSGSSTADDKVKGLDLGAVDYVTKPFDAFELRARVRAALRAKRMQDLLVEHAYIDPLTGLPNRRALVSRLHQEWARATRIHGELSFIIADIDHFKRVNDTFGHDIGDRLLQKVAKAIGSQCRAADLPGRYGGEEFAIVVPGEPASNAAVLAERCRQEIKQAYLSVAGKTARASASFGVADTTDLPSPEALVQSADEALYEAKNSGRNTVRARAGSRQEA